MSSENSSSVMVVGCKLPHGLILRVKNKDGMIQEHQLKGANASRIVGGFGLTENIPEDFMKRWLQENAKHPAVVNGFVFIHTDTRSAESMAKERRTLSTGLEAIDPVAANMLRGENGEVDKAALANYNMLKAKNPDRNRQQVE